MRLVSEKFQVHIIWWTNIKSVGKLHFCNLNEFTIDSKHFKVLQSKLNNKLSIRSIRNQGLLKLLKSDSFLIRILSFLPFSIQQSIISSLNTCSSISFYTISFYMISLYMISFHSLFLPLLSFLNHGLSF